MSPINKSRKIQRGLLALLVIGFAAESAQAQLFKRRRASRHVSTAKEAYSTPSNWTPSVGAAPTLPGQGQTCYNVNGQTVCTQKAVPTPIIKKTVIAKKSSPSPEKCGDDVETLLLEKDKLELALLALDEKIQVASELRLIELQEQAVQLAKQQEIDKIEIEMAIAKLQAKVDKDNVLDKEALEDNNIEQEVIKSNLELPPVPEEE